MKHLTLIRHGKSSWDWPSLQDFERPLNARGWRDSPRMADVFAEYEDLPDQWVSSHATRALTTARIFAHHLRVPVESICVSEAVYETDAGSLLEFLQLQFPSARHIVVFGHNPGMEDLAQSLCPEFTQSMPTCAIVQFAMKIKSWKDLAPGCAALVRFDYPKKFG